MPTLRCGFKCKTGRAGVPPTRVGDSWKGLEDNPGGLAELSDRPNRSSAHGAVRCTKSAVGPNFSSAAIEARVLRLLVGPMHAFHD